MQGQVEVVGFSPQSSTFGAALFLLLIFIVVVWFTFGSGIALKGASMDPSNRIPQMYGYTVCLVTLIVALATFASIVDAAFDRAHPLQSEYPFGASLTSYEAFKATYARERAMMDPTNNARADTASDATLRVRYRGFVEDRRAATLYRTSKRFLSGGLLFVIAVLLFAIHWRWVRRMSRMDPPAVNEGVKLHG